MASRYEIGDSLRKVQEFARVHLPTCIPKKGECGCSRTLIPQPPRHLIRRADVDIEVSERDYGDSLAEYSRLRTRGEVL